MNSSTIRSLHQIYYLLRYQANPPLKSLTFLASTFSVSLPTFAQIGIITVPRNYPSELNQLERKTHNKLKANDCNNE